MKTLVLGLGNPLLTDDGVGLRVARELRPRLMGRPDVVVEEDYWGGLRLMERMVGYDRSIVIDAVCGGDTPGTIRCLHVQEMPTQHTTSAHDATLSTALRFGHRVGAALPALDDVLIVAVEAADVTSFGEECTPQVAAAIPRAVEIVLRELRDGVATPSPHPRLIEGRGREDQQKKGRPRPELMPVIREAGIRTESTGLSPAFIEAPTRAGGAARLVVG